MSELAVNPDDIVIYDKSEPTPNGDQNQDQDRRGNTRAERRINALTGEKYALNNQLQAERQAKAALEAELHQLRELQVKHAESSANQIESIIAAKEQQMLDAQENAEFKEALEIQREIRQLEEQRILSRIQPQQRPEVKQEQRNQAKVDQEPPAPTFTKPEQDWYAANSWFDKRHDTQDTRSRQAFKVFAELSGEGYTADDPETFQELTRRLRGGDREVRPSQPGHEVNDSQSNQPTSQSRGRITADELAYLGKLGYDINDMKVREQFMANRVRRAS